MFFFIYLTPVGLALSSVAYYLLNASDAREDQQNLNPTRAPSAFLYISTLRFALLRVRLMWSAAENYTARDAGFFLQRRLRLRHSAADEA